MRRLPKAVHTAQPWLIHEIADGFVLEDVWELPSPGGGPDDFAVLISVIDDGLHQDVSGPARLLFQLRWKLGSVLGLDRRSGGLGRRVESLRDRVPAELRTAPPAADPLSKSSEFTFLYERPNERAMEIANQTMHGVVHFGWVPDGRGGWRGQMAVLVKPNGRFGAAYMGFIKPFRHLIVYPALGRVWDRRWRKAIETHRLDKR
jgi:hypothetical protein